MTAPRVLDPARLLTGALGEASPDVMLSLLQSMIDALLCADADAMAGAEWGTSSADRLAQRNEYLHRDLDTRIGNRRRRCPEALLHSDHDRPDVYDRPDATPMHA